MEEPGTDGNRDDSRAGGRLKANSGTTFRQDAQVKANTDIQIFQCILWQPVQLYNTAAFYAG